MEKNLKEAADISIVIVCWNNKNYLEPCLKSIIDAGNQVKYDIVVVDNGSTDGSQALIRAEYPQIRLIENGQNVGLSRASNQGIEATSGRYILLYNNDTLMEPSALDKMVQFMDEHLDAGAAGGRLVNADRSFQSSHCVFPSVWKEILNTTRIAITINKYFPSYPDTHEITEADWISSACLVVRRATLEQVGLLDDAFFFNGDEVDLQYRMHQAGWKVYFIPSITTVHYGTVSMNRWRRRKFYYRGTILFFHKHFGLFQASLIRLIFLLSAMLKMMFWLAPWMLPGSRQRARVEIESNVSIIKICTQPYRTLRGNPILA